MGTAIGQPGSAPRPHFEVTGPVSAPAVVVLGGISASAHVAAHPGDPAPGWWEAVGGPGGALDPRRFRVIGVDHAVPESGVITTHDQARVVAGVLDQLGVRQVTAMVGASYGGMTALAFGEQFPRRVERLVVCCAAHEPDPWATAMRVIQRRILQLGVEASRHREALELARALGMVTYRTGHEFARRFGGSPAWGGGAPRFPVEEYLDHQARRFADRFPLARYLALSESLDLHRVTPARIRVPVTLVASRSDLVVPLRQMRELAARLPGPVQLHLLYTDTGHDAFLTEAATVSAILSSILHPETTHGT